jgi:hypothetical protein
MLDVMHPGVLPPFLRAKTTRFRARLAAVREEVDAVEPRFQDAERIFREFSIPFWLAVTELEHAEWLAGQGRASDAEVLVAEAREIFGRLGAVPWLERASALAGVEATA